MRLDDLQLTVRRHRGVLAGLLTAGAVATALPVLSPPPPPSVRLLAAARDLAPGRPLTSADLVTVSVPRTLAPAGSLAERGKALGRALSSPVRRGELLTDVRLLDAGLAQGAGLVAAPIRLADSATVALLHAGDHVDVLAASTAEERAAQPAVTVARDVQVLAVPALDGGDADGGLIVVAATPATAARLASAAVAARLSVTVLPST